MKRTPLQRRTAIRRTPFPRRRPAKSTVIPWTVRQEVEARSGGLCEWPSCPEQATDLHHRLMRSQGGKHTVENLAALCRSHHRHIHDHPAQSYESGWLIKGGQK